MLGDDGELALRAWGAAGLSSFRSVVASGVGNVLVNAELDLVWYSTGRALWVLDTTTLGAASEPVLIATGLPAHGSVLVRRQRADADAPELFGDPEADLVLEWSGSPRLEAGDVGNRQRAGRISSPEWLARGLARTARSFMDIDFAGSDERLGLPEHATNCADPDYCGASLPSGRRGGSS